MIAVEWGTPHGVVKASLREDVEQPGGGICPTCTQHAQVYRRKINAGMAVSLLRMFAHDPVNLGWLHVPTVVGGRSREEGKLAYWGLVEEELVRREDGGRAGFWRVTELGRLFAQGRTTLPKYARIYNGRCLGLDTTSHAGIRDALGTQFSYDELMAGL